MPEALPGPRISCARNDHAIREKSSPTFSIHGSADRPSNTTEVNGEDPSVAGGTGCTFAAIFTVTVFAARFASGSASRHVACHIGSPES